MGYVEPVAPELELGARVIIKALLLPLAAVAGYFVAWGFCYLIDAIVRGLFGTAEGLIGWVPWGGKVASRTLVSIEHKITSYIGGMEAQFEHQMATRFHAIAALLAAMAANAEGDALWILQVVRKLDGYYGKHAIGGITAGAIAQTKVAKAKANQAGYTAGVATKVAGANHPPAVVYRYGATTAELPGVISWDLPNLRARVKALEDGALDAFKWIKAHPKALAATAFSGAVAVALGALGGGWIRCSKWQKLGKAGCNMPTQLFESLLALVTDFLVLTNICTVIPWLEAAFSDVAGPLIGTLTKAGAGLCGGPTDLSTVMTVPQLYVPTTADATPHLS